MNCWIDLKSIEDDFIQFKSRFMSDPTFTDIDSEIKIALVWTTLKNITAVKSPERSQKNPTTK